MIQDTLPPHLDHICTVPPAVSETQFTGARDEGMDILGGSYSADHSPWTVPGLTPSLHEASAQISPSEHPSTTRPTSSLSLRTTTGTHADLCPCVISISHIPCELPKAGELVLSATAYAVPMAAPNSRQLLLNKVKSDLRARR